MLRREEIEKIALERGEISKIVEKDYLLEILLFVIYRNFRNLIFKGGTALYKLYSLNRFSEDLDFTCVGRIDIDKFTNYLSRAIEQAGISGRIKESARYRNQCNIKFELKGPLFDGNLKNISFVSINISFREIPIYEAREERIYPRYRDIPFFMVLVMHLEEILAEKIRTILTLNKARDVYDCWFLLNKGISVNLSDVNKKLKIYKLKFSNKNFVEKIEEKRKSWIIDLKGLVKGKLPDFDIVKNEILEKLNNLNK